MRLSSLRGGEEAILRSSKAVSEAERGRCMVQALRLAEGDLRAACHFARTCAPGDGRWRHPPGGSFKRAQALSWPSAGRRGAADTSVEVRPTWRVSPTAVAWPEAVAGRSRARRPRAGGNRLDPFIGRAWSESSKARPLRGEVSSYDRGAYHWCACANRGALLALRRARTRCLLLAERHLRAYVRKSGWYGVPGLRVFCPEERRVVLLNKVDAGIVGLPEVGGPVGRDGGGGFPGESPEDAGRNRGTHGYGLGRVCRSVSRVIAVVFSHMCLRCGGASGTRGGKGSALDAGRVNPGDIWEISSRFSYRETSRVGLLMKSKEDFR